MATLNFHVNDDTKAKLDWLASSRDDTYAGLIRSLIQEAFTIESKTYREDKQFLEWQSQRST